MSVAPTDFDRPTIIYDADGFVTIRVDDQLRTSYEANRLVRSSIRCRLPLQCRDRDLATRLVRQLPLVVQTRSNCRGRENCSNSILFPNSFAPNSCELEGSGHREGRWGASRTNSSDVPLRMRKLDAGGARIVELTAWKSRALSKAE